jgi:ABC-2 type transport system ATP-binding protein
MLRLEHLYKSYGDRSVLQDLSFSIASGEIYGLLGPNGAGKTTTINILCNLLKADSGTVLIGDRPVSEATKALIGVVPQENLLYRSLSCRETLSFFGKIYGLAGTHLRQRVQKCLEAVNLVDRADSVVETLSGGMKRRLSMAIALVHQPKLVILDEPTTGLDIEARYEVWTFIRQLQEEGITVLLTTHLLEEAERLCQRIGILQAGQLKAEGTLEELRQRIPAKEVVVMQTTEEEQMIARGQEHGFTPRRYGTDLVFWIPEWLELRDILERFEGIAIDSVSRQPVRLEHIYIEVTQSGKNIGFPLPDMIPDPWE